MQARRCLLQDLPEYPLSQADFSLPESELSDLELDVDFDDEFELDEPSESLAEEDSSDEPLDSLLEDFAPDDSPFP